MKKNTNKPTLTNKTLDELLNGLSGIALSDKDGYTLTANRLLRGIRSGKFLSKLNDEWKKYQEKGKISSHLEFDEIYYDSLSEILEYLDHDIPNHKIFEVLKNIFIKSAIINQKDDLLPLQFLRIAKKLNEGELIVLSTIYRLHKNLTQIADNKRLNSSGNYIDLIAKESGLKFNSLVEIHELNLINKKLITGREYEDGSGVKLEPYFRLTDLGKSFCEYIEEYK